MSSPLLQGSCTVKQQRTLLATTILQFSFIMFSKGFFRNPFPNNPWFLRVCKSFKNTEGKEEIACNDQFLSFFTMFSTRLENFLPFSSHLKLQTLSLEANNFSFPLVTCRHVKTRDCLGKGYERSLLKTLWMKTVKLLLLTKFFGGEIENIVVKEDNLCW